MTVSEARKEGFTHFASLYGIPCYYMDSEDNVIVGTNWFYDWLLTWYPQVQNSLDVLCSRLFGTPMMAGFPIKLKGEL